MESDNLNDYSERRKQQASRFAGATILTMIASRMTYGSIRARKVRPQAFQPNDMKILTAARGEAISALALSTGLTIGVFSMTIFGIGWIYNISNLHEFAYGIKKWFGTDTDDQNLESMDKETEEVTQQLSDFFSRENK
ncbi:Aim11p NDAI_0A01700 [Naumovozyma dairenensis CBS 421]|uniref:Altered inheritance of mitochondria protein 11 n=1 Tax=Naumovozyma dairenensis (strain ATCC 10597 / BCRC 20456 / CBS 421 / NBRC 0211 / NRRL Y-12639) TaxID=1071378 RepID=G0W3E0_NAUDC|nr:hypothetical protein NDAI_0A01700 [Naumovozyma dairenensis CBS 421]CCD22328.1 hypothetical protein NDAI_0A01700 [Naumovozyma dairenensis CBS 421]